MSDSRDKFNYLAKKEELLRDFGVELTKDILNKLSNLYPDDIAIENYTRKIILDILKD